MLSPVSDSRCSTDSGPVSVNVRLCSHALYGVKKSIMELEVTFLLPAILFTVFALYFAASLLRPKSGASSAARKRESSGGDRDNEEPQLLLSSAAPAEAVSRGGATGDIQQVKCFNFTLRYSVFCLCISFCLM